MTFVFGAIIGGIASAVGIWVYVIRVIKKEINF